MILTDIPLNHDPALSQRIQIL